MVQQKVLGIIPSSTAGGSQTYTTLQPRTSMLNIRASTPGSQQQVHPPAQALRRLHNLLLVFCCAGYILMCFDKCHSAVFNSPQIPAPIFFYLFIILLGSGWWADPSGNDSHSNTDPANGPNGKGSYSNASCSAAR